MAYYYQYPALTILFYPPLFYLVIAGFFALFGVSHATAVATVCVFLFLLTAAVYAIVLNVSSRSVALAAGIFLMASPELMKWARQVMLDIPMLALAAWSGYWFLRYNETQNNRDLVLAAALIIAAAYIKQTALIIFAAFGLTLLIRQGWELIKRPQVIKATVFSIVALIPLAVLQYQFGRFNIVSVTHRADVSIPRGSWEELVWYAARLDEIAGLVATGLALIYFLATLIRRPVSSRRDPYPFLLAWFVIGYIMLTVIHLKETRHGLLLTVPIVVAAALSAESLTGARLARNLVLLLAVGSFAWAFLTAPSLSVTGYRDAANWIADHAEPNERVAFAGNRDGSFIFNVRAREDRRDISIVRVDKLLLNINIMPELGLNPRNLDTAEIVDTLNRLGIGYVVAIPGIWSETPVMAKFHKALASPQFEEVARFPVTGETREKEVILYKNRGPLSVPPQNFTINLPAVGITIDH